MASPGRGFLRSQAGKTPFSAMPGDAILVLLVSKVSFPFLTHPLTRAPKNLQPWFVHPIPAVLGLQGCAGKSLPAVAVGIQELFPSLFPATRHQ